MIIDSFLQVIISWLMSVKEAHIRYWDNNYVFIIVFVLCFTIILWQRKNNRNGYNLLSSFCLLLITLVLYNPIAHYFSSFFFEPSEAIRTWLLLPVGLVVAYSVSQINGHLKPSSIKVSLLNCSFAVAIMLFGSTIMSYPMMIVKSNDMKINDESIHIADIVLNDNNNSPTSLLVFTLEDYTYDQFVSGGTVSEGIKQYTGLIDVSRVSISLQYWEENYVADISPAGVYGVSYVPMAMEIYHHTIDYEYIAMPASDDVVGKMNAAGFNLVGSTDHYYVYKANSDWELISLDFTHDDGTDLFVVRDRIGHYVFIATSATQDIEQILNYIRSTTIEIDAWIISDSSTEVLLGELIEKVQIDRIYSCEECGFTIDNNQVGNAIELYGIDIVRVDNGDIVLYGATDEYRIVLGQTTDDMTKVILE